MEDAFILKVNDISASYGQSKVLFGVSFNLGPHERIAIVGRNGAGKTTLLKCVAALLKPTSGFVVYEGEEITGRKPFEVARAGLKYVHQDKGVFQDLTVRENLKLSSYATGDYDWSKVFKYFPKLKILLDKKGAGLSGGEKQMLMIGRAILGSPKVLLLDEPTEGLAPGIVSDLATVFCELSENTALVIVDQNLSFISKIAQRVYGIKEGKMVVEISDTQEIQQASYSRFL
ncbi:MAG: branched-chain amino acid transport system ATP-binding protein [Candidatus Atribacteria bacterium]|nr:branched-chain amino acid transport system ATP-binding protein [Candidatus Atribacteria bacterium]